MSVNLRGNENGVPNQLKNTHSDCQSTKTDSHQLFRF